MNKKQIYTIGLTVDNEFGVLTRVTALIRREGWNIKSLSVDETERSDISRMTIDLECAEHTAEQVIKRLSRLASVRAIDDLTRPDASRPVPPAPKEAGPTPSKYEPTRKIPERLQGVPFRVLAINPGSTSTKVAVFDGDALLLEDTIRLSRHELDQFDKVADQLPMRRQHVLDMLERGGVPLSSLHAVVGRGGLVEPMDSGTYYVSERMLHDLKFSVAATHASSLGGIIGAEIALQAGIPSFVVDPVVVDELDQYAKLTGLPGIERRSVFHALNQKAVARHVAGEMGTTYENSRFIIAHMGGGITVGAHRYGRVIDVNDAMAGEGPFTPERTGGLPAVPLIELCFSGAYTKQELIDKITQKGGMSAYLGTNDLRKCERLIKEGDEYAALVLESMAYQISKDIGAMVAVLEGRVDAIILTGGLAHSNRLTGCIKQRVSPIAPVKVYPGEDELRALAEGALRILRGEEQAVEY